MPTKRLHLVDGTYELFRAHYSPRPGHSAPDGKDFKATVGVVGSLLALLDEPAEAVTHLAVAFDNPIVSFRNRLYAGYKSDEGMDPALRAQFDDVEEAVRAIGVTVWSMDEHEADDGLATGAALFRTQVGQVRIMTPDKDLGQCVRGDQVVQVDRRQQKELNEAAVIAARGVPPASIPDLLALTGDSADGFPGLKGFGAKTAAALLARYGHLEDIPREAAKWDVKVRGAPMLAQTFSEGFEEALLYRKLATVVEDVPLRESLSDLEFAGVPRRAFLKWADRAGVTTLRDRPKRWRD